MLASSSLRILCNTEEFHQQIVTAVTINQLLAQGLDILTPVPLVEVRFQPASVMKDLRSALISLYSQIKAKKVLIELDERECRALRCIQDIVLWVIDESLHADIPNKGPNPFATCTAPLRHRTVPRDESDYWVYVGVRRRHERIFTEDLDYSPNHIANGIQLAFSRAYEERKLRLQPKIF